MPTASAADHHLGDDPHHRKIHLAPLGMFVFCNSGAATVEGTRARATQLAPMVFNTAGGALNRRDVPPGPSPNPC